MTDQSDGTATIELNRPLLGGGLVLVAVGGLIALTGSVAAAIAVLGATRSWVSQWEEPPSALARRRYAQARSAALAGAQVWRQNGQPASEYSVDG
jgi:hypothetical protein